MKKSPFLLASGLLVGLFAFFLLLAVAVANLVGQPTRFTLGDKVGVIEVFGVISDSREIIEHLHRFRDNDSIKAIVLRIDSPGGGVGASQEIHDEVRAIDQIKPVVASMGSVAASGGYYIAAPARKIIANPGTITGSIGVIMQFANFQELLKKIGLYNEVVKSGPHKDLGSPVRPMSEADRRILQAMIDDVHDQFVASVAVGRDLDPAQVRELADGRIFTGRQAREFGLVDELGNLQVAIARAGQLARIEGEPTVVYPAKQKPRLLDYLIEESQLRLQQVLSRTGNPGLYYLWQGLDQEVSR
ncbi:MAG: signal peptide peptidase SppA [Desulfuromonadales bacterium]|nr:signal peptide peptidase SppA [Desulfuromonadales bacterium]